MFAFQSEPTEEVLKHTFKHSILTLTILVNTTPNTTDRNNVFNFYSKSTDECFGPDSDNFIDKQFNLKNIHFCWTYM